MVAEDLPMAEPTDPTPYFHALAVFACKSNRLYRVYVRHDELVFIWAGSGTEGMLGAQAAAGSGGLIGAAIGGAVQAALDPSKKNAARLAVLDSTPLERLIDDHPKNMRAPARGSTEVRIGKRSNRHARVYSDHAHQALLYLRHRELGRYLLGFASAADVRVAMRELPRVVGDVYAAEIEPPERDQKCECVFCAR
jgi:hypothetical protein